MTAPKYPARPDHVYIGNHTWSIAWLSQDQWAEARMEDAADALTLARRNTIVVRLDPDASESHYQETLWHEITHAIWDNTMLTHQDLSKQDEAEEFVVALVSPWQLFVIKQNPKLVQWLQADGTVVR